MTDTDNTPPPVPPKEDLRPMTPPKDFPRMSAEGYATVGASTSTATFEVPHSTSNTFPGAKGTNKNLTNQLTSTLDEIFVEPIIVTENTNKASVLHEPRVSKNKPTKSSENVFSKISWWLSWGRLKPKKNHPSNNKINSVHNHNDNSDSSNNDNLITPSSHSTRAVIPSSSSSGGNGDDPVVTTFPDEIPVAPEPSIKVTDPDLITNDAKIDELPKVKKSNSITNLFRRLSYRKRSEREENSSSSVMTEDQSRNDNDFSTMPRAKVKNKKSNLGSLIEKLNRKFSFTNDHHRDAEQPDSGKNQTNNEINSNGNDSTRISSKPPRIDWSLSSGNRKILRKPDLKQKQKEVLVDVNDFRASTLFPDESPFSGLQLTAAETLDVNVAASSRNSVTKSSVSSERADDDTIKGDSGTIRRRSRIFDLFNPKSSSTSTRGSQINVNGVNLRHDRTNSNNNQLSSLSGVTSDMPDYLEIRSSSNSNLDMQYSNMEITSRENLTSNNITKGDKINNNKSPFRIFKKKFYKSLLTSHPSTYINNTQNKKYIPVTNSTPIIVGTPPSPTKAITATTDPATNGYYEVTNAESMQVELMTSRLTMVRKRSLSRMSSFAKSFNSDDPSAFGTAFSNHDEPNSDYTLENAWDALINLPLTDNK
ncbi:15928_t:CDS:2, partial [Acaulospora morrowiae]